MKRKIIKQLFQWGQHGNELQMFGIPLSWRSNAGFIYICLLLPPQGSPLLSLKTNKEQARLKTPLRLQILLWLCSPNEGSGNNSGIFWHNWKHSLAFSLQIFCSQWNNKWAHEPILTATQGQILLLESLMSRCKSKAEQEYVGNCSRIVWLMDLLKADHHNNKNFGHVPDYFKISCFIKVQLLQPLCQTHKCSQCL